MASGKKSKAALVAWAFYDWANNGFATVILTFIFSAYFVRRIAPDGAAGATLWGMTASIAGLLVALGGPLCGAVADQNGRRKPWLIIFMLLCVSATALMWFVKPSFDFIWPALVLLGAGIVGSEYSLIYYNAMLPELAPEDRVGRWSGWGWALGYAGGLICLLLSLWMMGSGGLPDGHAGDNSLWRVRLSFLLAAGWYLAFSLPLIFLVPDTRGAGKPLGMAIRAGTRQLVDMIRQVRRYRGLALFLIARMIYIDGLATIFTLGGIYAAGVFNMSEKEVMLFGILINVAAGLGAGIFAGLDDKIGPKTTILISLAGLSLGALVMIVVHAPLLFWSAGAFLGIFVGPVQAGSRSYMARMAPENLRHQMFGLYAFSGKATAFAGPFLVAAITHLSDSQRMGMITIPLLLIMGGILMLKVPQAHWHASSDDSRKA